MKVQNADEGWHRQFRDQFSENYKKFKNIGLRGRPLDPPLTCVSAFFYLRRDAVLFQGNVAALKAPTLNESKAAQIRGKQAPI